MSSVLHAIPFNDITQLPEVANIPDLLRTDEPSFCRIGKLSGLRTLSDRIDVDAIYVVIPRALVLVDKFEIIYMTEDNKYFPQLYAKPWAYATYLQASDGTLRVDVGNFPERAHALAAFMPFHVASGNWFHTILDNYARLVYFNMISQTERIPIGVPHQPTNARGEVLTDRALIHRLFLHDLNTVALGKGIHKFDRVIIPPLANWSDYIFADALKFVSARLQKLVTNNIVSHPLRLFVSRSDTPIRNLTNERHLTDELKKDGFTVVCPGDFSFRTQLELFASAQLIVGVHGQGLTPVVCADRCTAFLEFEAANWAFTAYRSISELKGIKYQKLPAKLVEYRNYDRFDWSAEVDIESSIEVIRKFY